MEGIKHTIQGVFRAMEKRSIQAAGEDPQRIFKDVLAPRERKHARISAFKNGVVHIRVDSSGWLYQMNLGRDVLLAKLRRRSSKVKDLRLRLGQIK
ncbi:DciA family protein [Candidatus Omnitrophota bacterium]